MTSLVLKLFEIVAELMTLLFGVYFFRVAIAKPENMLPLMFGKKLFGSDSLVQFEKLNKSRIWPARILSLVFSLSFFYVALIMLFALLH